MHFSKKLNLLPQSYKDRYANKYIMLGFGVIVGIMVFIMLVVYANFVFESYNIKRLMAENTEFQSKQTKIVALQQTVDKNTEIISDYQKDNFPFYFFMQTIANQKPEGLTIISIDSVDRLVTMPIEKSNEAKTDITETKKTSEEEKSDIEESTSSPQSIHYEKDLSKSKLVVRGYSSNPSDVAGFINTLATLSYVADIELKAIEEHTIDGINMANIFEAIVQLK